MPNVAAFNSDNPANPYMEGEVNLGMVWNGSAYVARRRYAAGSDLAERRRHLLDGQPVDPGKCENVDGALKLINFLLRPDVAKQVAETIGYPTPNPAARKCSARPWPTINRSIRTPPPSRKANGKMTSAAPALFMKSITRS